MRVATASLWTLRSGKPRSKLELLLREMEKTLAQAEKHAVGLDKLGEELIDLHSDIVPLIGPFGALDDRRGLYERWLRVQDRYGALRRVSRLGGEVSIAWHGLCINPPAPSCWECYSVYLSFRVRNCVCIEKQGLAFPHSTHLIHFT